ncbi:Uncharacterised protein [Streptococcus pneumoniae]|nr:Uncharacterised protein [Streptococcus pneumoniae]
MLAEVVRVRLLPVHGPAGGRVVEQLVRAQPVVDGRVRAGAQVVHAAAQHAGVQLGRMRQAHGRHDLHGLAHGQAVVVEDAVALVLHVEGAH